MITVQQVEHVAKLARLSLTTQECEKYTEQLSRIIEFFDELNEVDTTGVEPMSHPIAAANVLREDVITSSLTREVLMVNAPLTENIAEGNFFRVPKIGE